MPTKTGSNTRSGGGLVWGQSIHYITSLSFFFHLQSKTVHYAVYLHENRNAHFRWAWHMLHLSVTWSWGEHFSCCSGKKTVCFLLTKPLRWPLHLLQLSLKHLIKNNTMGIVNTIQYIVSTGTVWCGLCWFWHVYISKGVRSIPKMCTVPHHQWEWG